MQVINRSLLTFPSILTVILIVVVWGYVYSKWVAPRIDGAS